MDFWGDWLIAMRLSGKNGGDKNEKTIQAQTQQISRAETKHKLDSRSKNSIFGTPKEGTATEAEGKANKLMENSFILFASFSVSHAFGNLLHFQCVCSPVLGTAFFAVTKRDRDNIFILFCAVRWLFSLLARLFCLNNYSNQNKLPRQRVDTYGLRSGSSGIKYIHKGPATTTAVI